MDIFENVFDWPPRVKMPTINMISPRAKNIPTVIARLFSAVSIIYGNIYFIKL